MENTMIISDNYYTSKEVKEKLCITRQTLMRWKNEGKIRVKELSKRKVWYLKEDVDKLVN